MYKRAAWWTRKKKKKNSPERYCSAAAAAVDNAAQSWNCLRWPFKKSRNVKRAVRESRTRRRQFFAKFSELSTLRTCYHENTWDSKSGFRRFETVCVNCYLTARKRLFAGASIPVHADPSSRRESVYFWAILTKSPNFRARHGREFCRRRKRTTSIVAVLVRENKKKVRRRTRRGSRCSTTVVFRSRGVTSRQNRYTRVSRSTPRIPVDDNVSADSTINVAAVSRVALS